MMSGDVLKGLNEVRPDPGAPRTDGERYRALFEAIDEGFCVIEVLFDADKRPADYRFLDINPAFVRQTGLENAVGRTMRELAPDHEQHWFETYGRIALTGEPERFEDKADALGRWYDVYAFRIDDPAQRHVAILFRDILPRKRAEDVLRESEERQAFLLTLSDALAPLTDAIEVMAAAARLTGQYLGLDRCGYGEVDPGFDHFVFPGWYQAPGIPEFPRHVSLEAFSREFVAVIRTGEALAVEDVAKEAGAGTDLQNFVAARVDAFVGVPLIRHGRLVGILSAHQARPRAWTPAEVTLLREVLNRTAAAVERARAERALRASEEKYRTLFDSIDEGFAVVEVMLDEDGKPVDLLHLEANKAYEQHTGLHDIVGRRAREIVPEGGPWLDFYGRVALTGEAARNESYLAPPVDRWIASYACRIGGEGSRKVAIVFNDVTDRRRAETVLRESEERQTFLLQLSDALRPLADPVEIMETASALLGRHLGVGRCGYGEVDATDEYLVVARDWTDGVMDSLAGMLRLADFGDAFISEYRAGRTVVLDDVYADDRAKGFEPAFEAIGELRASLAVPLVKDGFWVAVFYVQQPTVRHWTPTEETLVRDVAERTWAAVERARAEAARRESEEKYRTLFASMAEGFCIVETIRDGDGRLADLVYREANQAYAGQAGFQPYPGLRVKEIAPDIEDDWMAFYDRVSSTGVPETKESFNADLERWFRTQASRIGPDGSPLLGIVFEDVTERKRAELALRESEDRQTFLLKLSDALRPMNDPAEMLRAAMRHLCEGLGVSRATYYEVEDDQEHFRISQTYSTIAQPAVSPHLRFSALGFLGGAYRAGETLIFDDIANDPRLDEPVRKEILARGASATVCVPLVKGGRLIAMIGVHQPEAHQWTPFQVAMLQETAERTWDAVERARAEVALRESEEKLQLTVKLVPALLWWADPAGKQIETTPGWMSYTGQTEAETQNFGWLDAVHPDDLPATKAAFEHAFKTGEPLELQHRIHKAGDGYVWHLVRHVPVRDAAGTIGRWFGAAIDVDELYRLQERQQVLLAELQHRVRNILTVVRSVFARSVEADGPVEEIARHFSGRLDSLARTQVIVTQSATGLVDLENLIRDELLSVGESDGPTLTIAGPDVTLRPTEAESMGLAIHELTTNALKYGALKVSGARLDIHWSVNMDYGEPGRLDLTWREQGVPAVPVRPSRRGFGSELLEEALPYRLGAETKLEFRGGGVCCSISLPLPDRGASAADAWKEP